MKKSILAYRICLLIKGLAGTFSGYEYAKNDPKAAFIVLAVGAVANEIINVFFQKKHIDLNKYASDSGK